MTKEKSKKEKVEYESDLEKEIAKALKEIKNKEKSEEESTSKPMVIPRVKIIEFPRTESPPQNLEQDMEITPVREEEKQPSAIDYVPATNQYTTQMEIPTAVERPRTQSSIQENIRHGTEFQTRRQRVMAQTELKQLQNHSHEEYVADLTPFEKKSSRLPFEDDRKYEP